MIFMTQNGPPTQLIDAQCALKNWDKHNFSWRAQLTFDVFGWLVGPKLRNPLHNYKDLKKSGRRYTSIEVKLLKVVYWFKQNRATAPLATPSGGSPAGYIGRIRLIHSVGGVNGSPWWWWLGVVLVCFEQRKKTYYSYIEILRSNSVWFPPEPK